jgi:hypothetical protein
MTETRQFGPTPCGSAPSPRGGPEPVLQHSPMGVWTRSELIRRIATAKKAPLGKRYRRLGWLLKERSGLTEHPDLIDDVLCAMCRTAKTVTRRGVDAVNFNRCLDVGSDGCRACPRNFLPFVREGAAMVNNGRGAAGDRGGVS